MKVIELIEILMRQDGDKEVLIQQGGEHEYMTVDSVKERIVFDTEDPNDDDDPNVIVIEFC
jgi:hypothetical protein